jgi:hypothetical protein
MGKSVATNALYDADFLEWTQEQGRLLRAGRLSDIDIENLAEEIESLGRSDKRALESDLIVILVHLLKWAHQPEKRKAGWRASLIEHRARVARLIADSPSLASYPGQTLDALYPVARAKAAAEMRVSEHRLPAACPYAIGDVLADGWLPGG